MNDYEIGVCGWIIDRHDVLRSIRVSGTELGLRTMQLGFFTHAAVESANADQIVAAAREAAVSIVGSFLAFEGEDYSSIDRIAATGGFMADEAYAARLELVRKASRLTAAIGSPSLAVHAGTVPANSSSAEYIKLRDRIREVADFVAMDRVKLLLETGREPAERLVRFMEDVGRPNIAVNFDPANFVVYGTDEPSRAVTQLKGRIQLVHLKDATRSSRPGIEFGRQAPFGHGHVEIARVISKLRATGYRGPLLVECDTRDTGLDTIRHAVDYLRTMLG